MSITQCIHRGNNLYPNKAALIDAGQITTYGELYSAVRTCAAVLVQRDTRAQDRVCVLAVNGTPAVTGFYGAAWAGMIPNYLNHRWSLDELTASINDCTPSVLMVDNNFLSTGLELKQRCHSIRRLIYIGNEPTCPADAEHFASLVADVAPLNDRSGANDDTALINYTGGTTGKGKGVVLTHAAHISAVNTTIAEQFFLPVNTLVVIPLFHISGILTLGASLALGNTAYLLPAFDLDRIFNLIESDGVELVFLVPTMIKMMLDHPNFSQHDLSNLKHVRYGGSPIDEALLLKVRKRLPQVKLAQVYGQTEGAPATFLHPQDHITEHHAQKRTRSAGTPVYGTEIQILDRDETPLSTNRIGQVAIRSPFLMTGYWNNPEETAKTLKNGWLMTGDAGYLSEDGYLYLVDRVKDMIITGGENVYSSEVENAICSIPGVSQCAVVGIKDETWGERVHAEVVLTADASLTEDDIIEASRQLLAGYKVARSINIVENLPLTAVGKIDKVRLRNLIEPDL